MTEKRRRSGLKVMADASFDEACRLLRKPRVTKADADRAQVFEDISYFIDAVRHLTPEVKAEIVKQLQAGPPRRATGKPKTDTTDSINGR